MMEGTIGFYICLKSSLKFMRLTIARAEERYVVNGREGLPKELSGRIKVL